MVTEGGNNAGPSGSTGSQAATSLLSSLLDDSEEEENEDEEVNITRDSSVAEEEDGYEGESDPRGANPDPYLFYYAFCFFWNQYFDNYSDDLIVFIT